MPARASKKLAKALRQARKIATAPSVAPRTTQAVAARVPKRKPATSVRKEPPGIEIATATA